MMPFRFFLFLLLAAAAIVVAIWLFNYTRGHWLLWQRAKLEKERADNYDETAKKIKKLYKEKK